MDANHIGGLFMPFRISDAVEAELREVARTYYSERFGISRREFLDLVTNQTAVLGPVVRRYPVWHPLLNNAADPNFLFPSWVPEQTRPEHCGYEALDHTIYFSNGFITFPYRHPNGSNLIQLQNSVSKVAHNLALASLALEQGTINGEPMFTVRCNWDQPLEMDGTIPLKVAVKLILHTLGPVFVHDRIRGTDWSDVGPLLLGEPYGSVSSPFVNKKTGQGIRRFWKTLVNELYGKEI